MTILRLIFCGLLFVCMGAVSAQTVVDIEVQGQERMGKEAVLQYVSTKKGDDLRRTQIRDDLKTLYNSGLFQDIQIDVAQASGGVKVIIRIKEKDYIQEIKFEGHEALDREELDKAIELKVPFLWDEAQIKAALEKVRKSYRDKGFYLVTIRTEVIKDGNKKTLTLHIDEGKKVEVRKIYFQGNKFFRDEQIKEQMITREGGHWSTISGSGRFDEDMITQVDGRRIQMLYWKNGFAFAKIDVPSVTFTPDRTAVFLSFHIEEGDQFDVGDIGFSGDMDFIPDAEKLKSELNSKKGELWNYLKIQEDIQKIQDLYGDQGYAYANVSPDWRINPQNPKQLDLEFRIDKGNLVYFGSIDVQGNLETYDRIVRRELEFTEGELFNTTRFRESKKNLEKLGYFQTVKFIQNDVLAERKMDVVIEVEERQTGTLTLGASFSSFDRFGIQGAVSKVNLFGRGYDISLTAQISSKRQLFSALFKNPRVFDSKFSLTVQGFNTEYQSLDEAKITERGGSLTVGYPLTKTWSVSSTYSLQDIGINIRDVITRFYPNSFGLNSSMAFGITRDTLNVREIFLPTSGSYQQLSTTVASQYLGSKLSYSQSSYVGKKYYQVIDEDSMILPASVLSFGLRADYLRGIEGRSTPFNERYVPGGIYSIRGHPFRSLSRFVDTQFSETGQRRDDSESDVTSSQKLRLGGNKQVIFNTEFLFDIFREAKIKGVLFFDAGGAFPESEFEWADVRVSTGFGFRWFSPLGPLRFEWGIPLDRKAGEDSILFDFSIGSPF